MLRCLPLLLLLALLLPPAPSAQAAVREPLRDALSYDVDLTASAGGRTWTGTVVIGMRNAGRTPLRRVWLRAWGNGVKGCSPKAVTVIPQGGARTVRVRERCTALAVDLPQALAPGATTTLPLAVTITAPPVSDRFGAADEIDLFGNALPVLAQRDRGAWRLPRYSPNGESWVTTWASYRLTLRHPAALQVAASGTTTTELQSDGATAITRSSLDGREAFWAVGPMESAVAQTARGTVVRVWSPTEAVADRKETAPEAAATLTNLERYLPDYPYDELDVVVAHIDAGGGMEYPGAVITDGTSDVTRHEVGHQWFYALVGGDQYREPWVDEGLTSFLEYTWTTRRPLAPPACLTSAAIADIYAARSPRSWVAQSMSYWNRNPGRYRFAYANPTCALRQIRRQIGDAQFRRTLLRLIASNREGLLTGAELREAFNRVGGAAVRRVWGTWGLAAPR